MFLGTIIVSALLAMVLVGSGVGKLMRASQVVENLSKAGVPDSLYGPLALLEFAAALGLIAGLWIVPLGVAAAIGVILYFVGAVAFHVRAKDTNVGPPVALGLVGIAALVLRLLSA